MTRLGRNAIRHAEKDARRRNRQEKRSRRVAASVAAFATVAAVGAGQMMSHAPAQADCADSTGTGIALVLPGEFELVPVVAYDGLRSITTNPMVAALLRWLGLPGIEPGPTTEGSATVIGSGFQFALAYRGGEATAISYLPLSLATAGASDGRKAYAFALIGMANAWTTEDLPVTILGIDTGLDIPGIHSVSCYGGLTGAYAEGVGACANVLGTLDFRWDATDNQIQFGLTDPSAVLFDPAGVFVNVITQLLNGEPLSLSKDFARLTISRRLPPPDELLRTHRPDHHRLVGSEADAVSGDDGQWCDEPQLPWAATDHLQHARHR